MSVLVCDLCEKQDWSVRFDWNDRTSQFVCHTCLEETDEPDHENDY